MKSPYVVRRQNGDFVASAITISGIRERLLRCKAGEDYNVSGGVLGGQITGRKTRLRKFLRTRKRYDEIVPYVMHEETADYIIIRLPSIHYPDVLELLARVFHWRGFVIEDLERNLLVVKKKGRE